MPATTQSADTHDKPAKKQPQNNNDGGSSSGGSDNDDKPTTDIPDKGFWAHPAVDDNSNNNNKNDDDLKHKIDIINGLFRSGNGDSGNHKK